MCLADAAKLLKSPDITLVPLGKNMSCFISLIHGPPAPKCYLSSGFINLFDDSGAILVNNPLVGPPGQFAVLSPYAHFCCLSKQFSLHEGPILPPGKHVCVDIHHPHIPPSVMHDSQFL